MLKYLRSVFRAFERTIKIYPTGNEKLFRVFYLILYINNSSGCYQRRKISKASFDDGVKAFQGKHKTSPISSNSFSSKYFALEGKKGRVGEKIKPMHFDSSLIDFSRASTNPSQLSFFSIFRLRLRNRFLYLLQTQTCGWSAHHSEMAFEPLLTHRIERNKKSF